MNTAETNQGFVAYEYTSVTAKDSMTSLYKDCYKSFGWLIEGYNPSLGGTTLRFKRNRRINNRSEVCNLQRRCETALQTIEKLEDSKYTKGITAALAAGLIGTAFMAGATFCYLGGFIVACVLLAIPGFIGWGLAYPLYKRTLTKSVHSITPQIDHQYDAIYEICEEAGSLLV